MDELKYMIDICCVKILLSILQAVPQAQHRRERIHGGGGNDRSDMRETSIFLDSSLPKFAVIVVFVKHFPSDSNKKKGRKMGHMRRQPLKRLSM